MTYEEIQKDIEDFKKGSSYDIDQEIALFKKEQELAKNKEMIEQSYPQTLEGKYLQPLYDVAEPVVKGLSVIEKPLSLAIGAGRSIGKGISGQENALGPITEELSSPFPTPAGSIAADIREAGYGNEPLLKGIVPNIVKQEFPKVTSVIEGVNPNAIADIAVSGAYGAKLPAMAGAEKVASEARNVGLAKKALLRGSEKDIKYVGELQNTGKLDTLANKVLSDKNVRSSINNPEKMVEYLQGIKKEVTDPITGRRTKQSVLPGKLDEIGGMLGAKVKELTNKTKLKPIMVDDYVNSIVNEIIDEANVVGSGIDFSPEQLKAEVAKYVKQPVGSTEFDMTGPATLDLNDIVNIKRGAADKLYDIKSVVSDADKTSLTKTVADKLWKRANEDIFNFAEKANDYGLIDLNNQFSDYQKIRELYANKDIARKYLPSLFEDLLPAGALGTAVGVTSQNPYLGVLAAGGYQVGREAMGGVSNRLPSMALGARMGAVEPALGAISRVNPAITSAAMMVPIPLSTERAAQDPEMVYAKISRDFGPQQAELFKSARSVEQVRALFRTLQLQNPQAFEQTKYNNIDGYIDPAFKQQAINDIVKDKGSPSQNALKMETLLHEGKIIGE